MGSAVVEGYFIAVWKQKLRLDLTCLINLFAYCRYCIAGRRVSAALDLLQHLEVFRTY